MKRLAVPLAGLLWCAGAAAQTVSMGGSLGNNALLVIDGKPRNVAVGATVEGIKLVTLTGSEAVVELKGKRIVLRIGEAQVNLGGKASEGGGKQIVLTAQSGGHFHANGAINGQSVRFMVDTGATGIALTRDDARRAGLAVSAGMFDVVAEGASGEVKGEWVTLDSVKLGREEAMQVPAVILDGGQQSLLGQSFLQQFSSVEIKGDRMLLR
jgi:aspartyl protease family protein